MAELVIDLAETARVLREQREVQELRKRQALLRLRARAVEDQAIADLLTLLEAQ
jgi:hypothetical protein